MSAHTQGPWRVDAHTNVVAEGGLVAFPGIAAGFDQHANARLIAAAPELLAALKLILTRWDGCDADDTPPAVEAAREIVAKAEGGKA